MTPIADALRGQDSGPLVYRLFAADSALLYVGKTRKTLRSRLSGHRHDKEWWPEVAYVTVQTVSAAELARTEKAAIRAESPAYNRVIGDHGPMTPAQIADLERQGAEYGRRSRIAQGLPPQVTDPVTLRRLIEILGLDVDEPGRAA